MAAAAAGSAMGRHGVEGPFHAHRVGTVVVVAGAVADAAVAGLLVERLGLVIVGAHLEAEGSAPVRRRGTLGRGEERLGEALAAVLGGDGKGVEARRPAVAPEEEQRVAPDLALPL